MATYKQIQAYVKEKYNVCIKPCWIAHAKEICGIRVRNAPNRYSPDSRTNPCPESKFPLIKDAFKHFKMI